MKIAGNLGKTPKKIAGDLGKMAKKIAGDLGFFAQFIYFQHEYIKSISGNGR